MGKLIRALDWSRTPLGAPATWSSSLRTAVRILLDSGYPMYIAWGQGFTQIYNDAYRPILGLTKHPDALGASTRETFAEIWEFIGPMFNRVMETGEASNYYDQLLALDRNGFIEECYFTFSYSAIREDGQIGGVFVTVIETTPRVLQERRQESLRALVDALNVETEQDLLRASVAALSEYNGDLPFFAAFRAGQDVELAACAGVEATSPLLRRAGGPISSAGPALQVVELPAELRPVLDPWPEPLRRAAVVPVFLPGAAQPCALLAAGLSPRLIFDHSYEAYLEAIAEQVAKALAEAHALEAERRRAEALAEIDRAKTLFFSNVSHEFRTPLTLMLGPLEEVLRRASLAGEERAELTVAHRNGLRLLKLVNSLLDFSRVEAGRAQAVYEPVDLARLTADLASNFRSACQRAGIELAIDCPALPEPVLVDRDMWEKIVLNLLSNAFKFTFEGEIAVTVWAEGEDAVLTVRDSGTGIPDAELPRIFERFHRVGSARGRTHEGTGIGLALVQELVKLHGGRIEVASTEGKGTTFTVRLPFGSAHLPAERIGGTRTLASTATRADAFIEEALRWLPEGEAPLTTDGGLEPVTPLADGERPRVLLADDNADMREYVERMLAPRYEVEAVADGQAALEAARARRPDLVLSDVMMPRLDGFGLLQALRAEPQLRDLPVVLLSARAGEEAQVEGLEAGADDYLVKPFSARELLARIQTNLDLARARKEAGAALRQSETRFRNVFQTAYVSIWEEDWSALVAAINELKAAGVSDFRAYSSEHPEFVQRAIGLIRIIDVNDASLRMFGAKDKSELMASLERIFVPETSNVFLEELVALAEGREGLESDVVVQTLQGERRDMLFSILFSPEDAELKHVLVTLVDITERKRVEVALRESEARFRHMADNAPVMIWLTDADGSCSYLSRSWYEFTGQTPETGLGTGWLAAVHPDDVSEARKRFLTANDRRKAFRLEYRLRRADGEYRWSLDAAAPRFGANGESLGYVGSVIDITERKQSEQHLRLLVDELNHRVKNTLATVQSIAAQALRDIPVAAAVREAIESRLIALSLSHDLLARENWETVRLGDVARQTVSGFANNERFSIKGEEIRLRPKAALALGMAFHELATNAAKYGALSNGTGSVDICWNLEAECLRLRWQERGGPPVRQPSRKGFGSRLIERGLPLELDGEVNLDYAREGVVCELAMPLPTGMRDER